MLERSIFMQALDCRTVAERSALLDEACAHDPALRQRVEALLLSHASAGPFLDQPILERLAEQAQLLPGPEETQPPQPGQGEEQNLGFLSPSESPGSMGKLGHYEVQEIIGRGGMGIVLQAFDERLHRVVAIKVMAAQLATSATARKRFIREARAAAAISHDHIVTIHAVEEANGLPYIAMHYVAGQSLQQKIERAGHLELKEILRIGQQIAAGLAAAHAHGLMHRDVKPANILLENGVERVRITDFGLARAVDDVGMTCTGEVAGTPQYMSPEQAQGLPMDARSDLFSLGCVLYAMCTGRSPFRAETTFATVRRVCEDKPRPIREVNPEIPPWFVEIIDRLLAKQPADRIQSAAEVAELLSRHLAAVQHPSTVGQFPAPAVPSVRRTAARSHPLLWSVAAVLLCAGLLLGLSEAGGVTKLTTSVIRVLTPQGTLIIEVDEPDVSVTVEGDGGLVIKGAGPGEVRLPIGEYKVRATKNGQPVKEEIVSISRGGKQTVSVSRETFASAAIHRGVGKALAPRAVLKGHSKWVESFAFSPDGNTVATSSGDHHVRFWNLATGDQTGLFLADHHNIAWSAYSPDGKLLVTGSLSKNVRVWNAATRERLAEVKHDDWVWAVAFRRRDSLLATCSRDKTVKLWKWDGTALVPVRTLEPHSGGVTAIAYSPSGDTLAATTTDGMLSLWDVESGQQRTSVRIGGYELRALAFSPDGKTIAVGGFNTHIELRNAETLESVGTLQGHRERVWSVAFLPDGESLLSAGGHFSFDTISSHRPGELLLWDIATLQQRLSLPGHELGVRCVAISPDGKTLSSGDFAGVARLWDVATLLSAAGITPGANNAAVKHPQPATAPLDANRIATGENGTFVLIGSQGIAERKFDTLAAAVQRASDSDMIEIRGNGPFFSGPINVGQASLTIRAGAGFHPVIKLRADTIEVDRPLLQTSAPLVIEGLELQGIGDQMPALRVAQTPLWACNCRFRSRVKECTTADFYNCEFIGEPAGVNGHFHDNTRIHFDNCLFRTSGAAIYFHEDEAGIGATTIAITRSTFTSGTAVWLALAAGWKPADEELKIPIAIRLDLSDNVVDTRAVLGYGRHQGFGGESVSLNPLQAQARLLQLAQWRGEHNLFRAGSAALGWGSGLEPFPARSSPEEWNQMWGDLQSDIPPGTIRYQGGNLLGLSDSMLDQLMPEDFRLTTDSAGYRAGPDGKDLGADVDLVGPGAAYERWKKTPEYQEWLKETGQKK